MTSSEDFRRLLDNFDGPVGNGRKNAPDDVERMKRRLNFIGFLGTPKNGFSPIWDRDTDNAVFAFQKANGLRSDGVALPGSQTDRASSNATFQTFAQNVSDEDDDETESSFQQRLEELRDRTGMVGGGLFGAAHGSRFGPFGTLLGGAIGAAGGDLSQGAIEDAISSKGTDGGDILLRIPPRTGNDLILRIPRRPGT